ncbi:hypothetical protein THAOC_11352 [Thalassiosira oceanica]|uniref:Uncharacterized protein n=1 Tax=Thalassiosira oceanica TaxID=159749 RepID=K0SRJ0_THAOC|nr:hypothetical protein THAOC_11352 [Thalassiosira oceanica]|eukprot:EJK67594.1 hypothetical protein THAOC_11352 [Thalassiosira oceanica]
MHLTPSTDECARTESSGAGGAGEPRGWESPDTALNQMGTATTKRQALTGMDDTRAPADMMGTDETRWVETRRGTSPGSTRPQYGIRTPSWTNDRDPGNQTWRRVARENHTAAHKQWIPSRLPDGMATDHGSRLDLLGPDRTNPKRDGSAISFRRPSIKAMMRGPMNRAASKNSASSALSSSQRKIQTYPLSNVAN